MNTNLEVSMHLHGTPYKLYCRCCFYRKWTWFLDFSWVISMRREFYRVSDAREQVLYSRVGLDHLAEVRADENLSWFEDFHLLKKNINQFCLLLLFILLCFSVTLGSHVKNCWESCICRYVCKKFGSCGCC